MYLFFLERYPHGIFPAGGAKVPTQEKKKPNNYKLVPSFPPKMKILSILAKNCSKIEI